jgi:hypothetical protein
MPSPTPVQETAQEIRRLRQEYERGLLSIIVDQGRREGFDLIESAVRQMAELTAAPNQWELIRHWLLAQQNGQLRLTNRSFGLLRDLGKVLKQLDSGVTMNASGQILAEALLVPMLPEIRMDLATLGSASPNESSWFEALRALAKALDAWQRETAADIPAPIDVREGFAQIHNAARALAWDDAKEISESLMNMLDRLVDGTLKVNQDHRSVSQAALALLETLSLPQAGSAQPSQIDDAAYERVIERADVLASGGSFAMLDRGEEEDNFSGSWAAINPQLAAVLEAIPALVADTLDRLDKTPEHQELRAELEHVARIAGKLLDR